MLAGDGVETGSQRIQLVPVLEVFFLGSLCTDLSAQQSFSWLTSHVADSSAVDARSMPLLAWLAGYLDTVQRRREAPRAVLGQHRLPRSALTLTVAWMVPELVLSGFLYERAPRIFNCAGVSSF